MANYMFNIYDHIVFQPPITPKSHHAPPSSIILELTVQVCLATIRHDCLAGHYSVANTLLRQITLVSNLCILESESLLHEKLAPYLNGFGINTRSVDYHNFIREIMARGLGMLDHVVNRVDKGNVLPLHSSVFARCVEHDCDNPILMRRIWEELEAELERANHGMVAAKASSIEELKKVRVEDETNCVVCLDELKVESYASQLPCSHFFHACCIEKWLKQSHYCPICRYEMPTNDE